MNAFNNQFGKLKKVYTESPESYKGSTVESKDVITFVYFIPTGAIAYGNKGEELYHTTILRHFKGKHHGSLNVKGDIDKNNIEADTVITGRIWVDSKKLAIWDYIGNFYEDIDFQSCLHNIGAFFGANLHQYQIEVTKLTGDDVKNAKEIKFT
jgi:hypothetical protein